MKRILHYSMKYRMSLVGKVLIIFVERIDLFLKRYQVGELKIGLWHKEVRSHDQVSLL